MADKRVKAGENSIMWAPGIMRGVCSVLFESIAFMVQMMVITKISKKTSRIREAIGETIFQIIYNEI
jgi:hypothetical protein